MKKFLSILLAAAIFFMQLHVFAFESGKDLGTSSGEYLIRFRLQKSSQQATLSPNNVLDTREKIERVLRANLPDTASVVVKDEIIEAHTGKKTQLVSVAGENDDTVMAQLRKIEGVEYVEPNYKIEALTLNNNGL